MTLSQRAIAAAARAMEAKRAELQQLPLARIYKELAEAGLSAALAVDGLCLVPKEELAVVLYAASLHDDEGPAGEGWQSTALEYACENVEMCLAAANDGEERSSPSEGKI